MAFLWFLCGVVIVVILSQMSTQGIIVVGVMALVYCFLKLWLEGGM